MMVREIIKRKGTEENLMDDKWKADEKQMEFAVFCVENLATDLNMDPTDTYEYVSPQII